jgi:hypothetical protein
MGWSERHALFERLLAMRDRYPISDDRTSVLSIADAIRYGEAVMTAVELDVEPWLAELDQAFADEDAGPPARLTRQRRFASDLWPWPSPSTLWPSGAPEETDPD